MLEFETNEQFDSRKSADLLALPFWKSSKKAVPAFDLSSLHSDYDFAIKNGDFIGKEGEVLIVYDKQQKEQRIALLGLGEEEKVTIEKLRRAYGSLAKSCRSLKLEKLNIIAPHIKALTEEGIVRGVVEGLLLFNYAYTRLKNELTEEQRPRLLTKATLIGFGRNAMTLAKRMTQIAEGVYLARDLINGNADEITPQFLADFARAMAKKLTKVKTVVFDKKRIEKEKMGLLLAVNQGSSCDPAFIIVEYQGDAKSKDRTVVIGKGVTYDTGGLNLKPTGSMETMKCDMSGAATALGVIYAAAKIGLKTNVTAVIPATENSIGSRSFKPGDVYTAFTGKTVEIGNTDAEGRLILADALAYTVKHLKPTRIIDFATLTGSMEIALGSECSGMMSNQDALADALIRAGYETYERLWRMPLFEEYKDQLKSEIADIKNIGGRPAGPITAAMFLQQFVGDTPWAHCDIAATAYLSEPKRYLPRYGTGVGVRLMMEFLENL